MKVLIISYGGLAEDAKIIFREYLHQGIDLYVIAPSKIAVNKTYYPSGFLEYKEKEFKENYRFFPVPLVNSGRHHYFKMFNPFKLYKAFKKIKPDVVHVFNEYSSTHLLEAIVLRNLLYGKNVPVLCYVFENIPFGSAKIKVSLSGESIKSIIRSILRPIKFFYNKKNVNGIVGVNEDSLKIIKETGINVPMVKIFPGISLNLFFKKDKSECRKKVGLPEEIKLAGYFGRISEGKGIETLIGAISNLNDYGLVLLGATGEGKYEDKIRKLVDISGIKDKTYFIKSVPFDKLNDYYNSLDVFVLASETQTDWKEQYGRVLVEAMSCQLPVVGSSSGAIPEVINGYPKGLIFKEKEMNDLTEKIRESENVSFNSEFNLKDFLEKYSIENFVKTNINFYKKILEKNGKN